LEETVVGRAAPPAVATSAARLVITRRAALSLPGLALLPGSATAADYPSRGISIVVPFAPGGGTDVLARIIAKYMVTPGGILWWWTIVQVHPESWEPSCSCAQRRMARCCLWPRPAR
jgi:hypothetical protein